MIAFPFLQTKNSNFYLTLKVFQISILYQISSAMFSPLDLKITQIQGVPTLTLFQMVDPGIEFKSDYVRKGGNDF